MFFNLISLSYSDATPRDYFFGAPTPYVAG